MELIKALNWRYAAKKMTGAKVAEEKIDNILEAVRLSASSVGIQPYQVLVISNQELKNKIYEAACQQPQILESSHLLVFAPWLTLSESHVDEYMERTASIREIPVESLSQFSQSIKGGILSRPEQTNKEWMARQAYIALGFGIVAAAVENVDATPMEGFNADALNELLNLKEKNLHSVAILAIGHRDEEKDFLANAKKVRQAKKELFIEMI